MLIKFLQRLFMFFIASPIFNATSHAEGGFGLAIILQYYIQGNSFLPVSVGWTLLFFSLFFSFFYKEKN